MAIPRLLGHATITFTHHPSTISLHPKDSNGVPSNLASICESATPPCQLNPLLFNGHLQTCYTAVKNQDIPVYYKRHVFSATDPTYTGTFAVDFVVPPYEGSDENLPPRTTNYKDVEFEDIGTNDEKPMLVTLHGLSGGSHELYLRHVLEPLFKAGWEACVVTSRGCAMSKITSGVLYNARSTWDLRQVVKWLRETFPRRPLFGIGYSMGANIMTNYLGEEGDRCILKAAVVCSNPWNLETGSLALNRSWIGREIYSKTMGQNLKKLFEIHIDEISKNPRIDIEKVRKINYLYEFDRELQAPTWGYPTERAYYRDASSVDSLLAVKIPFFAINAEDDPIAMKEAIPYEEFKHTPYAVLCTTSLGGHLSWFERGGGRWFVKPATQFLTKMATEFDLEKSPEVASEFEESKVKDDEFAPSFDPMRRKLRIHISE